MALEKKYKQKHKFIIYNGYIEKQFHPRFKLSLTSSGSPKMVTNQTLLESNYLSRETDSEPK